MKTNRPPIAMTVRAIMPITIFLLLSGCVRSGAFPQPATLTPVSTASLIATPVAGTDRTPQPVTPTPPEIKEESLEMETNESEKEVAEKSLVTPTPSPPTATPLPAPTPSLPPADPNAATNLQATTGCDEIEPRKGIATLSWTIAANPGSEQRLDLTLFKDGFDRENFESSGLLPPDQTSLKWEGLEPGLIYRWRVRPRQADEWVPSQTANFEGPLCVADFVSP